MPSTRASGSVSVTTVPAVLAPVATIFAAVADVFAGIAPVFEPIAAAAIVPRIAAVLTGVAPILGPVAPILGPVAAILAPVAHVLATVRAVPLALGTGLRHERCGRHQRQHQGLTRTRRFIAVLSFAGAGLKTGGYTARPV